MRPWCHTGLVAQEQRARSARVASCNGAMCYFIETVLLRQSSPVFSGGPLYAMTKLLEGVARLQDAKYLKEFDSVYRQFLGRNSALSQSSWV